jgi:hypothetical protein
LALGVYGRTDRETAYGAVYGKYLFQLYEAKIDYEPNQYGMVTSGTLFVQGRVISIQCLRRDKKFELTYARNPIKNSIWFLDGTLESLPETILCLCFHTGLEGVHGMTLKLDENSAELLYTRTGVFEILPESVTSAPGPFKELRDMNLENEDFFAIA